MVVLNQDNRGGGLGNSAHMSNLFPSAFGGHHVQQQQQQQHSVRPTLQSHQVHQVGSHQIIFYTIYLIFVLFIKCFNYLVESISMNKIIFVYARKVSDYLEL